MTIDSHHGMSEVAFTVWISDVLAEHPDWLGAAIGGITSGMSAAIQHVRDRASLKDRALLAALSFAGKERLTPRMRTRLEQPIIDAINPHNASPAEKEWLDRPRDRRILLQMIAQLITLPDADLSVGDTASRLRYLLGDSVTGLDASACKVLGQELDALTRELDE